MLSDLGTAFDRAEADGAMIVLRSGCAKPPAIIGLGSGEGNRGQATRSLNALLRRQQGQPGR